MRELVCFIVLLVGLTSAAEPTTQQKQNSTKEENSINKRYVIIPQYNPFFYSNSQVIPTQSLSIDPFFTNYINNLPFGISPYNNIPRYYILPRNEYIQTYPGQKIISQIQNNVLPSSPQAQLISQQVPQQIIQPQKVIPQQVFPQRVISQQIVPQRVISQQIVPQRVIPQQILPQRVIPQQLIQQPAVQQQIIPQRLVQQQVVPQQIIPQQVLPQQIVQHQVSQQILPQQIETRRLIPQQIIPQQVVPQQVPQQVAPQQVIPQQIIPEQFQQKIQNPLPTFRPQQIIPPIQHNTLSSLPQQHQTVPYQKYTQSFPVPLQHQYYQPQAARPQVLLKNEPYPYEAPPGQNTAVKQHPVYGVPQTYPIGRVQYLGYNAPHPGTSYGPVSYLQQNQLNSQPQTVYVNSHLQASGGDGQQVVRIGYAHPHLSLNQDEIVQNTPQTVYINPNLYTSYEGNQPVVRIGYVHPPVNQVVGQEGNEESPQKLRLGVPYAEQQNGVNNYQYGTERAARTAVGKEGLKTKETKTTEK